MSDFDERTRMWADEIVEPRAIGLEVIIHRPDGRIRDSDTGVARQNATCPDLAIGARKTKSRVSIPLGSLSLLSQAGRVESPSSKAGPVPPVGPVDEDDSLFARAFRAEMARS